GSKRTQRTSIQDFAYSRTRIVGIARHEFTCLDTFLVGHETFFYGFLIIDIGIGVHLHVLVRQGGYTGPAHELGHILIFIDNDSGWVNRHGPRVVWNDRVAKDDVMRPIHSKDTFLLFLLLKDSFSRCFVDSVLKRIFLFIVYEFSVNRE